MRKIGRKRYHGQVDPPKFVHKAQAVQPSRLIKRFRAGLNMSVNNTFRNGPIEVQFCADISVDGITFNILGEAATKKGRDSSKENDVVHRVGDTKVIEL